MNSKKAFFGLAEAEIGDLLSQGPDYLIGLARDVPATWHPNGFIVFGLSDLVLGKLRMHIWPTDTRVMRDASAHVHTHVWDLCSLILAGEYAERRYMGAELPLGQEFRSARIDYVGDPNTLVSSGTTGLLPGPTETFRPGSFHYVEAGIAHETMIPATGYAATVLITSPPRTEHAWVHSRDALPPAGHVRPQVAESFKSALLDDLRQKMDGPQ